MAQKIKNQELSGLGNWTNIVAAGASIFDSVLDSRTAKKANQSAERQLQLQTEAQQFQAEATQKLLKLALIGAGALLFGGIVISAIARKVNSDSENPKHKKESLKGVKKVARPKKGKSKRTQK